MVVPQTTMGAPDGEHAIAEVVGIQDRGIRAAVKVVRYGRYVTFQLAEVAVPRKLFQKILSLIDDLRRRPVPA